MLTSKWENLSRFSTKLIYVCKSYHLHWIAGRVNILSKYIIHKFFNFECDFCCSFPMLFPNAPASCCKKISNWFLLHCASVFMSSKSVSQIFKILFKTGDINVFVLRSVFFSGYVQLNSSFSDKTNISGEFWDNVSREAIEN